MKDFNAWCSFPAAPLTHGLIIGALKKSFPAVHISTSEAISSKPQTGPRRIPFLQWCTYDSLSHELALADPAFTLTSSYTIRKSLIRKNFLYQSLKSYIIKRPDSFIARHSSVPKTWAIDLSFADELDEMWSDELWGLGEILDRKEKKWFILKPAMSDGGIGIRLFDSKESLQHIFRDFDPESSDEGGEENAHENGTNGDKFDGGEGLIMSQLRHFVIQEYLDKPLLLDPAEIKVGRISSGPPHPLPTKFHLRVYCVASGALTLFVNENMLALFAGTPYGTPSRPVGDEEHTSRVDLSPHLTNTSWQKVTPNNPDPDNNVRTLQEMIGCRILSGGTTEGAEQAILSEEDVQGIITQVCGVLADVFRAALQSSVHFQPLPNAFELFGADLLVTYDPSLNDRSPFKVNILELNAEPAIEMTGARLRWVLEELFYGICRACVAPFVDHFSERKDTCSWKLGETRYGLRKSLEVEVRGIEGW